MALIKVIYSFYVSLFQLCTKIACWEYGTLEEILQWWSLQNKSLSSRKAYSNLSEDIFCRVGWIQITPDLEDDIYFL